MKHQAYTTLSPRFKIWYGSLLRMGCPRDVLMEEHLGKSAKIGCALQSLTEATPGKPSRRDHGGCLVVHYGAQWGDTPHGSVELTPYTTNNGSTKISDSGKGLIVNLPEFMFLVSAINNQPFSFTYCIKKLTSPLCLFLFTEKKARM